MLTLFIRRTFHGAWSISSNFGRDMQYLGYSKREAIKMYRESYGLKGKHITVLDI